MSQADDDLAVLGVPRKDVTFRGTVLQVEPLRLNQVAAFTTAARTIIGRVSMMSGLLGETQPLHVGAVILDLLEQDAGSLAKALAIATGQDADWIAGGTLDEVTDLVEAVVALNKDFFAHRLPALLVKARPAMASQPEQAASSGGPTTSPISSSTDTPAPTS